MLVPPILLHPRFIILPLLSLLMGRPPSNGIPAFRFTQSEVSEMETILQVHNNAMPSRDVIQALADKFSESPDRIGKIVVQVKQIWNWFQNKRYAIRAKLSKTPGKPSNIPMPRDDSAPVRTMPPGPPPTAAPTPAASTPAASGSVPTPGKATTENSVMEFEAKSRRDGAWYDVACFLSHRYLETDDPEVLVRFAGFGSDEDEWTNVRRNVRPRSLPCESSECIVVIPGDLILCFQEGREQALYFDAHVLDAQRRRHDVRGCRCRFLVRYDHDQTEEIVPLKKICRRPETEYRLQQLKTEDQQKAAMDPANVGTTNVSGSSETTPMQQQNASIPIVTPTPQSNVSQVPNFMIVDPKKAETISSSSETAPKLQHSNIPIVTHVPQTNVTPVQHMMIVDPMKAEAATNVLSGNNSIAPPGFASIITTGSFPEFRSQNMAEGK